MQSASPPETSGSIIRLPRTGCFITFIIFFFISAALATAVYHSLLEPKPEFEVSPGTTAVCDPDGVLTKEDSTRLEELTRRIARAGNCDVLALFADGKFADFNDIMASVREEWSPGKGVLLVYETRNGCLQLELLGGEWQLSGWDRKAAGAEISKLPLYRRGAEAGFLLKRLLSALETPPVTAEETLQPPSPAGAEDASEKISAGIEAQAAGAAVSADVSTLPLTGERNKTESGSANDAAVIYSRAWGSESSGSTAMFAIVFASVFLFIGLLAIRNGKKKRLEALINNPKVEQSYRERSVSNPKLKLVDLNREKSGFTHHPALKLTALILGIAIGWSLVSSVIHEEIQPDREAIQEAAGMPRPAGSVADLANVFSPEEARKLAGTIARAERKTGGEIMVLTVPTTGSAGIEEFSLEVASRWRIGRAGIDDGALLVLAVDDRRSRLEIGYGWEGVINDARAGDMLREIVPKLREERYADAACDVVRSISDFVTGSRARSIDRDDFGAKTAPTRAAVPRETVIITGIIPAEAARDPRLRSAGDDLWALIGLLGSLAGLIMAFVGRMIMTSVPRLVIIDPTVRVYTSYSSSGGSGRSSGGGSYSSSSGGSPSSRGGGSFGGGGASGSW